jgi:hypothetical protein
MERPGHDNVNFFTGIEVEHTPAHGKETLFVVGVQPSSQITPRLKTPGQHIYFGANQSFPNLKVNDGAEWAKWETMIYHYLDMGYLCTLDIDVSCAEGLLESGLTEYHNFIPMISVKLPYIKQLGYNATIKLDDKDFRATNPGVWCHSLHDLQTRDSFTDWSQYTKDEPV